MLSPDNPIRHPTTFTKNLSGCFKSRSWSASWRSRGCSRSETNHCARQALLAGWAPSAGLGVACLFGANQQRKAPPPLGPGEGFGQPKDGKKRARGNFRGIKLNNKSHWFSKNLDAMLARKSNAHPGQPRPCAHGQPSCRDSRLKGDASGGH